MPRPIVVWGHAGQRADHRIARAHALGGTDKLRASAYLAAINRAGKRERERGFWAIPFEPRVQRLKDAHGRNRKAGGRRR